jgi:hypothetical protein
LIDIGRTGHADQLAQGVISIQAVASGFTGTRRRGIGGFDDLAQRVVIELADLPQGVAGDLGLGNAFQATVLRGVPVAVKRAIAVGVGDGFNPTGGIQFAVDVMTGFVVGLSPAVDGIVIETQGVVVGVGDLGEVAGGIVLVLGEVAAGVLVAGLPSGADDRLLKSCRDRCAS